jgi:hypothetical protein
MSQMSEFDDGAAKRQRRKAFVVDKVVPLVVVVGTLLAFPIAFEQEMLSVSEGQAEVTVIGVQDDKPQGKRAPAWFRYNVSLSDGSRAVFISERVQQPGARIIATVSRGRITGRMWLTGPYRQVGPPDQASGAR